MKLFDWICVALAITSSAATGASATLTSAPHWFTAVCVGLASASATAAAVRAAQRSSDRSAAARAAMPKA